MKTENSFKASSGFGMLIMVLLMIACGIASFITRTPVGISAGIMVIVMAFFLMPGFIIVNPNESRVMVFFGEYKGTLRDNGFFWANPFFTKKVVSLKAMNLNGHSIKVNDKLGNPIEIAAVIVWQVEDTAKASFEVNDFVQYIAIQSEAAVRHLAGTCPYDNLEHEDEVSLRSGGEKVNHMLESELTERMDRAGIKIIEARISHLAYAQEIAGAMLQRQQATAVVAARKQIVEGAVGMVEMALAKLSEKEIVHLDEERKAAMVSNLLVVLCGDKNVSPVVNTGTLYN
ncbi:MAG: SPFH domain-containing protein [Bacteroidia bacterium]|jgi:regulator of protease activity HflC (stomatin/prohibitin superfamily)|nr:SPFH domain-containing protein [Bacteroidia bacterium]MBP7260603.1 SPFH domain-containing protein [Bacteroidia bacterium]MBP9179863.1 SPFH domain-containing protein [Bacteroidia bacterium]MBP9724225.1 SPFH domain-containing protein [Bacteroidia bacterium]